MTKGQLVWVYYKPSKKYYLVSVIGVENNKLYGLLAEFVQDADIPKIKAALTNDWSLHEFTLWIKANTPNSYNQFRSFDMNQIVVKNTYTTKT